MSRTLLLALLLALPARALAQEGPSPPPLRVLATVGMLADVAREVGGACVEVDALMGPGVDPHLYRAGAGDVRRLERAQLILYSGYALEGQLGRVLERFGERTPTVAVAEAAVPPEELITADGAYGVDPHLWMDPGLWARAAGVTADAVAELRPACAEAVRERADAYAASLEALRGWAAEAIATLPEERRVLVTAHDAFAYYGRAFGIDVIGIQGISTESEAGIGDIREVADLLIERDVPAVFVETTINPRTIRAVVDAAEERGHEVRIGAGLYSDAMGEPGTPEGTYIGMIRANTAAIVGGLGGDAPPLPAELAPWAERWGLAARAE